MTLVLETGARIGLGRVLKKSTVILLSVGNLNASRVLVRRRSPTGGFSDSEFPMQRTQVPREDQTKLRECLGDLAFQLLRPFLQKPHSL